MRVLFNCHVPFLLAHGGAQIQIEQTQAALAQLRVTVEPLRWWDERQGGDVLHHFGRIPVPFLRLAQQHRLRVVMSPFMSGLAARPAWMRSLQKTAVCGFASFVPPGMRDTFGWDAYRISDACVAMTEYEASLMIGLFQAPPDRIAVIPNGVEEAFLSSQPAERGPWLVCTAAIIELKQVLKLAQMAVEAKTPLWVIGKAYGESDSYSARFVEFARQNSGLIRYEGAISDRPRLAQIYREARGFVLLSKWESLSLSALEAAACQCPLLLSDLPWARNAFKDRASYCPAFQSVTPSAQTLRRFYDEAPTLPVPPAPLSWLEVGRKLKALYESLLNRKPNS
jgi:glycosyltransferase involved in cell wall biosynthesis